MNKIEPKENRNLNDQNKMVEAYFRMIAFDDKSKGFLTFPIRKYPNKIIETYTFFDGQKIRVPQYVINHLSTRYITAPANEAEDGDKKRVYRFELDLL